MALDLSSLCTSGLQFARAPCRFPSSFLITSLVELFNSLALASEAESVSEAEEMCTERRREKGEREKREEKRREIRRENAKREKEENGFFIEPVGSLNQLATWRHVAIDFRHVINNDDWINERT
ncbi:hypothetical protein Syun_025188 [Stephania yunnanensis]|uniref:Uncharacterized protein n=1 Tax=Stephania yunnanensis TaxID=152371 RepID=A0AAP0HR07_9MAGN